MLPPTGPYKVCLTVNNYSISNLSTILFKSVACLEYSVKKSRDRGILFHIIIMHRLSFDNRYKMSFLVPVITVNDSSVYLLYLNCFSPKYLVKYA